MTDPDAELDAILEQVEGAGLVERYVDEDGHEAMRLTPEGECVAQTGSRYSPGTDRRR